MTILQSLFLGVLQGLTEFLPVSSSGHLVVVEHLLGVTLPIKEMLSFDIVLHTGSLLAIICYYAKVWRSLFRSIYDKDRTMRLLFISIIIATIPAGIIGFLFQDVFVTVFRDIRMVGLAFLFTGLTLILSERMARGNLHIPSPQHSMWIGFAQALSIIPGISRSGITISMGRSLGLSREGAVDFSFLMAAPIIAGASLVPLKDVLTVGFTHLSIAPLVVGFLSSFVVSIFAILFLRMWVKKRSIAWFAVYLFPLGLILILV